MTILKKTRHVMGMSASIVLVDRPAHPADLDRIFAEFEALDHRFSPFRNDSELSRLNRGEIAPDALSGEMREILSLSDETNRNSDGYFNIRRPDGMLDPSGIVKGWAILRGANMLAAMGYENFSVEIGGDIQTRGRNAQGDSWRVGISNPFREGEIVKVLQLENGGVATSGSYFQGAHIYDPRKGNALDQIVSLSVVGPDILEADRYATAAFAMGREGIHFIERRPGLEAYEIDAHGKARMTSGLWRHLPC